MPPVVDLSGLIGKVPEGFYVPEPVQDREGITAEVLIEHGDCPSAF